MPRFEAATYAANLALLDGFGDAAREAGCTPAQLALALIAAVQQPSPIGTLLVTPPTACGP